MPRAKSLFFRKRTAIATLDIDGDQLVVVTASGTGPSARISRVASGPITWHAEKKGDPAADGSAIKAALDSLKLKPKEVLISIPRGKVVLRPLQVPMAADLREMAAVVNFQISRDLPFRLEEAVIDFKVLRSVQAPAAAPPEAAAGQESPAAESASRLEVLVGAIRSDLLEYYQKLASAAGLKLVGLSLRSSGLPQAIASTGEPCEGAALVVSIRKDEISLDIVAGGKLCYSRVAAVQFPASASSEDQSRFLGALRVEVVRSLHSYEGAHGQEPVRTLFLIGTTGVEQAVLDQLSSALGFAGKILGLPANVKKGESAGASALPAMGLALAALHPNGVSIDFANPKKPPVGGGNKRLKILIAATAAMVAFFILVGARAHLVGKRNEIKDAVQMQVTAEEKKVPLYRKLRAQTKVVQGWIGEEQNWLDHIAYLSAILPPADQLYVTSFATTPQHVIRMSVQAKTGELLAELDKRLRSAGYEVKPLSITPANDKFGYNFRTTVELAVPKKMKPDWTKVKAPPRPADDASLKSAAVLNLKTAAPQS